MSFNSQDDIAAEASEWLEALEDAGPEEREQFAAYLDTFEEPTAAGSAR